MQFKVMAMVALLGVALTFSLRSSAGDILPGSPVGCMGTSTADHIQEIGVFRVTNAEAGLAAAQAIVADAKAYNNAIITHSIFQDLTDSTVLVQHITWCSLDAVKDAFIHSEGFPHMPEMMALMSESLYFGYIKN